MACTCSVPAVGFKFPVLGIQPPGPQENWPVYFVPTVDSVGVGTGFWFCPGCHAGLAEARAEAGMQPVREDEPRTWFEHIYRVSQSFWACVFGGICPPPTAGKSQ